MNDLAGAILARLDAEEQRTDWPHRLSCQKIKPPPEGWPFDGFSCNCDASTLWLGFITAHRELIDDIVSDKHLVVDDCWYTCPEATEARDGGESCNDNDVGDGCNCGRDKRVQRRLAIIGKAYGIKAEA